MNNINSLTEKDIEEGKQLNEKFNSLSQESKSQAQAYLSALLDKEEAAEDKKGA